MPTHVQSIRSMPALASLDPATIPPEVIAALAEITSSLEALEARRRQEAQASTLLMMMMMMSSAHRQRAAVSLASDADVIQHSKDFIEALDRADDVAVAAVLAPGFVYFHAGRTSDRDTMLARLAQRRTKVQFRTERTWSDECLVHRGDVLVFTSKAHEVQGGNERHGGYIDDGMYLLQWARCGDGWRVQLLTWQQGTTEREWFNDTYRKNRGFSREANRLLIDTLDGATPGVALDLATGQGRNALYLAAQGWQVTGIDISDEGLRIAREQAVERGLSIQTIHADIDAWELGESRYDLVTMLYAGDHAQWIDKIKASLRDGGLIIVEGWAKESPGSPYGFSEGLLATLFDGYEILRDETVVGAPDWAWDEAKLVRFVARKTPAVTG